MLEVCRIYVRLQGRRREGGEESPYCGLSRDGALRVVAVEFVSIELFDFQLEIF
jgi:hypothetical protein